MKKRDENIIIEEISGDDIEICRDLCNELMALQQSKATFRKEVFDHMNFDTRMKTSYEAAKDNQILVVKDKGTAVGYIFSTIDHVIPEVTKAFPAWAPKDQDLQGFYPSWLPLPQDVGTISNLYLRDGYQKMGLGKELMNRALAWLKSHEDVNEIFVYISNGNQSAYDFYIHYGFEYSHEVLGGFIKATHMTVKHP